MKKINLVKTVCGIFLITTCCISDIKAQNVVFEWVKGMTGVTPPAHLNMFFSHSISTKQMDVDESGNVYITGSFSGTVDFDFGPGVHNVTATGTSETFVLKLDAGGNFIWVKTLEPGLAGSIARDGVGNIYMAGVNYSNKKVVKLDANGGQIWTKEIYGAIWAMDADSIGNVYVTGKFTQTATIDNVTLGLVGPSDMYVVKMDSSGRIVWAKGASNPDPYIYPHAIAVDDWGNVHTTGAFETMFFPQGASQALTGSSLFGTSVFILKMNNSGDFVWAKQIGSNDFFSGNYASGIVVDKSGNVYTTGRFDYADTDFDPGQGVTNLKHTGYGDVFVSKLDSSGNYVWAVSAEDINTVPYQNIADEEGTGITLDALGNPIIVGRFGGSANTSNVNVDFDPDPNTVFSLSPKYGNDAFIWKLSTLGEFIWAKQLAGNKGDAPFNVAVDGSGSIYTLGVYTDTADFDPDTSKTYNLVTTGIEWFIHKMICTDTSSVTLDITADCKGYDFDGATLTAGGTYFATFRNALGCDSFVTLNLTINLPEAVINVDSFVLGTTTAFNTYQWLKDGVVIPGATDSMYTVTENANYQVVVTDENGCVDTSEIYKVDNVSISAIDDLAKRIHIYPNPAEDIVYINSPFPVNITVSSIEGKVMKSGIQGHSFSVADLADGVYLLRITNKEGRLIKTDKVVKTIK